MKENLKVAVTLLGMVGFETHEAVNGEDAIQQFNDWSPHLILMDMRMPVMDGYEATKRIKSTEKGKNTPIVALTASTFEDELRKIESLGLDGYIRKPFRENELFNTIGKILGIDYLYEQEEPALSKKYLNDNDSIVSALLNLPGSVVSGMKQALSVADLDMFSEILNSIEKDNSELSDRLLILANNYDYQTLNQIFGIK
jgi:CheY-like chemotaxis protein